MTALGEGEGRLEIDALHCLFGMKEGVRDRAEPWAAAT